MDTFDISKIYSFLEPEKIPVKGNEHRITKVAFDVVRLDTDKEYLWQVQADDDGNEFLVRTYELPQENLSVKADWDVISDGKKANLTISYKGVPIYRMIAAQFGATKEKDVKLLQTLMQEKLNDSSFVARFLQILPESKRAAIYNTFPKLAFLK
jgi:hypothetical protein